MGNNQDKDKKFVDDSKNFYKKYYSNKIPTQLKAMLDQLDVFRNKPCYGTCICPHQQYRAHKNNKGIIYRTNQTFYYGDLVDNKAEGQGILFSHNFIYYKGQFKNGVPEGQGNLVSCAGNITILLQQGTWKEGIFICGKIHPLQNSGIKTIEQTDTNQFYIEFYDKSSYRGNGYIQDQHFYMHGIGIFQMHDNKYKYNGEWVKNVREGKCQLQNEGIIFRGICKEGKKLQGTLTNNQFQYQGKWENGNIFTGKATNLRSGNVQQFINNKKIKP